MKTLKNKHSQGFTLLELMLVIAIISAILVLGLSAYEQKLKNSRIETAAIEMQTWLQASLRFYVDNNTNGLWPKPPNGDAAQQIIDSKYMQQYQLENPWKEKFVVTPINDSNGTTNIQITTTVPQNLNKFTATMIAARVPFAKKPDDTDMYSVILNMPLPAIITKQSDRIIETITTIIPGSPPNDFVPKPECQSNYHAELHLAVHGVEAPTNVAGPGMLSSVDIPDPGTCTGDCIGWYPKINVMSGIHPGKGTLMAISMCVKNTVPTAKNTFTKNSNYLF